MKYRIEDIKDEVIRSVLLNIGSKLITGIPEKKITTIYVIGSSIPSLINGIQPSGDIDLILCFTSEYIKGKPIIEKEKLLEIQQKIYHETFLNLSFQYNGVEFLDSNSDIQFDLIPLSHKEINNKSPQVTIDLCKRDRILILGDDILTDLDNYRLKDSDIIQRIDMAYNYINRDLVAQEGYVVKKYLIKSVYYFLSLIFINVSSTLKKQDILYNVRIAGLPIDMSSLVLMEKRENNATVKEIEDYFIQYMNNIKEYIRKNGIITGHNNVYKK